MEIKSGAMIGMPAEELDVAKKMTADWLSHNLYFGRRMNFSDIREIVDLAEQRLNDKLFDGFRAVDY